MKMKGFTLSELIIALGLLLTLLIIIPRITSDAFTLYQEEIFLKRFEQEVKLAQTSAQTTGKDSELHLYAPGENSLELVARGEPTLNQIIPFPNGLTVPVNITITFQGGKGNLVYFGNGAHSGGTFTFFGKKHRYRIIFQFGEGRFYVETSPK